jgi:nucleoside-diphosphate-sugar epimerase
LDFKHSCTYTPDAAKATALLGNESKAENQVWHLPTAKEPLTGRQWIEAFAKEMNVQPKTQLASRTMVKILGLFNPIMKEFVEMLYQYDRDYVFDSSKFEKMFNFQPTSYDEGIKLIVKRGSFDTTI